MCKPSIQGQAVLCEGDGKVHVMYPWEPKPYLPKDYYI